ncbi:hypothetical protein [Mucilaginibacter antarcticus]|uniref:hypothetical protein n=1 Tax=Mucilaginibacter antarcticus TaxID=1855725 RepID=UPI00363FE597
MPHVEKNIRDHVSAVQFRFCRCSTIYFKRFNWPLAERPRERGNVTFLTKSTGLWLSNDGFLYNKMNYSTNDRKDVIELKFTYEIDRKHPKYARFKIKFLNDSTFLMRYLWGIPKNADTSNKKVAVYKKIKKELPDTEMRYPTYKDILGVWGAN